MVVIFRLIVVMIQFSSYFYTLDYKEKYTKGVKTCLTREGFSANQNLCWLHKKNKKRNMSWLHKTTKICTGCIKQYIRWLMLGACWPLSDRQQQSNKGERLN